jgi:ParB family transcriptional regulator, chromosome partitioning protein
MDDNWTPNGSHRLIALKVLGAQTIIGLPVLEPEVAFTILALNTEKAHNLREKSLETIRMARALAGTSRRKETDFAFECEEASFLTLGLWDEKRPRIRGGASSRARVKVPWRVLAGESRGYPISRS